MSSAGGKLHIGIQEAGNQPLRSRSYLSFATFSKLWLRHKLWTIIFSRSQSSHNFLHNTGTWPRRRPRDADDEPTPLGINFTTLEYAKETKVLEAPFLDLLYYADSVGEVPQSPANEEIPLPTADPLDIGNGDLPPEWGIDIAVRGGVLRYGPWTDRQRQVSDLFSVYFCVLIVSQGRATAGFLPFDIHGCDSRGSPQAGLPTSLALSKNIGRTTRWGYASNSIPRAIKGVHIS